MNDVSSVAADTFASFYQEVRDKVHKLVEPLSTEQLWRKPYPYGNSVGHLLLHLTGNLSHYIGARIAGTGYVRNRPLEFADASRQPKEEVLAAFDRAIDMVVATIRKQSSDDWLATYSDPTSPNDGTRFSAIQRMAAHADHHAGQMIYLAKELARTQTRARVRTDWMTRRSEPPEGKQR
jgi:uncharacterized damage-inducible protein DinB